MPLNEVRSVVQNILRGKILIGHGLENDLKALGITASILGVTCAILPHIDR
jgi:hypothetical protein